MLLCGLGVTTARGVAPGDDEALAQAARLLERMTQALHSLDYEGTLVYLIDNRLETLHLVHQIVPGGVQEHLVALSGPVRTLAGEPDRVTCVMPDGHPILVERNRRHYLLRSPRIDPAALTDRYRIALLGAARVAGRDTEVLAIRPRDALRYGYQFHLDRATGLPLKSDLIDDQGAAIEQLLFTSIDLGRTGSGPPPAVTPPAGPLETPPAATRWQFNGRVPGFELTAHDVMKDGQGAAIDHFVFSDQISSYSLYIEGNAADGLNGGTHIGAVHAAGRVVAGHQVTAVGQVPAATVAAAVEGVVRVPE